MQADFVIIGAGILGLTVARELKFQYPKSSIVILEKEHTVGLHASGRNSGILHAGIYYKSDSLKAKFCLEGLRAMKQYCEHHHLPIDYTGKLIVPSNVSEVDVLHTLHQRAMENGATVELIKGQALLDMEPHVQHIAEVALFSPETSVVDPKSILNHIQQSLVQAGVQFFFNHDCHRLDTKHKKAYAGHGVFSYGHLFNTSGLYADKIAKFCGLMDRYTMIPFKGMYHELRPSSSLRIRHLIYPVPDMNVPFLGVHLTKSIGGTIYVGPTAIPVLGREHYTGLNGIRLRDAVATFSHLGRHYLANKQGFRAYAHQEIPRLVKSHLVTAAQSLLPGLKAEDLVKSKKVGIRAQLFDKQKQELAMDFIVERTKNETHVLNAVSPAFTSSFSFSRYVVGGI